MLRNSKQPRVAPAGPPYDAATAAALEALGPPIALFRVFARRPDRARGIHGWGSYYLSRRAALTLRQRELVIDRTTARCASPGRAVPAAGSACQPSSPSSMTLRFPKHRC